MAKLPWQAKVGIGLGLGLIGTGCAIAGTVFSNSGLTDKFGDFGVEAATGAAKMADQAAQRAEKAANYVKQQMDGTSGSFTEVG